MNGKGTMLFKNGNKYTGQWKNGKFHGNGTFTFSYGKELTGKWKNGELVEEK